MDLELSELEEKINQLVDAVQQLRSENRLLSQQIAARTDEIKRLSEKIDVAKGRLQAVLEQIPEEAA